MESAKREVKYLVEFTATRIEMENGVVKSSGKTCVIAGEYDALKDASIRKTIDELATITKKGENDGRPKV